MIDYDKPILNKKGKPIKIGLLAQHHCIRCIKESRALQKVGYTVYGNGNKVSYGTDGYEIYHVWQNERQFKNSVKQLIDSDVDIIHWANEPDVQAVWIREVINEMHKQDDVKLVCDMHDLDSIRRKFIPLPERELFNASDAIIYVSLPIQKKSNILHDYKKPNIALFHYCNEGIIDYDPNLVNERKGIVYQGGANPPNDVKQNQMFQYRNLYPIMKRIVEMGNELYMFCGNVTAYDTYQDIGAILYPPTMYDEMMEKLTKYKYGLAIFNNPDATEDQVNLTLTNKMFEYLMCGVPTLACWCAETEKYVKKWNIGFTFDHINEIGDTSNLKVKYLEIMDNITTVRKQLVMENFIWRLENLYATILGVERKRVPDDILELSKKDYEGIDDFLVEA